MESNRAVIDLLRQTKQFCNLCMPSAESQENFSGLIQFTSQLISPSEFVINLLQHARVNAFGVESTLHSVEYSTVFILMYVKMANVFVNNIPSSDTTILIQDLKKKSPLA